MPPPPLRIPKTRRSGFSLVEVAIAISIFAIALVALLGLLPGGMTTFRKAMDTTVTAQIAQRIMHDFEQAEFNTVIDLANPAMPTTGTGDGYSYQASPLPALPVWRCPPHYTFRAPVVGAPVLRYFDEQGYELIPSAAGTLTPTQLQALVYVVNVRIMPRAEMPLTNETSNHVAQVTVQVARNPNNVAVPILTGADADPNQPRRNLFLQTAGVQIYTYYALLGNLQGT